MLSQCRVDQVGWICYITTHFFFLLLLKCGLVFFYYYFCLFGAKALYWCVCVRERERRRVFCMLRVYLCKTN